MDKPTLRAVAEIVADVAAKLLDAYDTGHRPSSIDVYDMHETLATIAERLDSLADTQPTQTAEQDAADEIAYLESIRKK